MSVNFNKRRGASHIEVTHWSGDEFGVDDYSHVGDLTCTRLGYVIRQAADAWTWRRHDGTTSDRAYPTANTAAVALIGHLEATGQY